MEEINQSIKPLIQLTPQKTVPLKDHKVGFFIDNSGSTSSTFVDDTRFGGSKDSFLDVERAFVSSFQNLLPFRAKIVSWNSTALLVTDLSKIYPGGGTRPSSIFQNDNTYQMMKEIEVAIILTDGNIENAEIRAFGNEMSKKCLHLKAVIGIVVGRRTSSEEPVRLRSPQEIDVSVLVPAMISDSCILFHNVNDSYLMWSTGSFKDHLHPPDIGPSTTWSDIKSVSFEELANIPLPMYDDKLGSSICQGYIPLGSGLLFNPQLLLDSDPSWDELQNMPFYRICQYFRVTQKYDKLYEWFSRQQKRFCNEFLTNINDRVVVDDLISQIRNSTNPSHLIHSYTQIRDGSIINRYREDPEIFDSRIISLIPDERVRKLLNFFKMMNRVMIEDKQTQRQGSSYTTSSISQSRYISVPAQTTINTISASFHEPFRWLMQYRAYSPKHQTPLIECSICIEKSEPCLLVRQKFSKSSLGDMIDQMWNYLCPQVVCCRCADYFCQVAKDPHRQPCLAALPIVDLSYVDVSIYSKCFSSLVDQNLSSTDSELDHLMKLFFDLLKEKLSDQVELVPIIQSLKDAFV